MGDIAIIQSGNSAPQGDDMFINGTYPFFRTSDVAREHLTNNLTKTDSYLNEKGVKGLQLFKKGSILFPKSGLSTYLDHRALMGIDGYVVSHLAVITIKDTNIIIPEYLYEISTMIKARDVKQSSGYPSLNESDISSVVIPLPPIDVQKQIVEEIGKVEKSNSDAKYLIDKNLSDIRTIINGLGSTVSIKEYFDINTLTQNPTSRRKDEFFTYVDIDSVGKGDGSISFDKKILGKDAPSRARRVAEDRTVIVSTVRPYLKGFAYIDSVPEKTIFSTGFALLKSKNEENYISKLLYYLFMFSDNLMKQMETAMPKAAYPSINKEDIDNFKIPLLTIDEQKHIVDQIEALESEITKARTLIENAANEKQAILDKYL